MSNGMFFSAWWPISSKKFRPFSLVSESVMRSIDLPICSAIPRSGPMILSSSRMLVTRSTAPENDLTMMSVIGRKRLRARFWMRRKLA